jgi:1,2-diacylglycerol 3-alpha-glucosyltransferase
MHKGRAGARRASAASRLCWKAVGAAGPPVFVTVTLMHGVTMLAAADTQMKIAIASSGLGHVARGIETWALDTATALAARGVDVTLFGGDSGEWRVASGAGEDRALRAVALPGMKRTDRQAAFLTKTLPGFTWHWGLKDTYGLEQFCFWRRLKPQLRAGQFDILHVQDPMLAFWCRRARRGGQVRAKEILAHGTEESLEFLRQFDYVQHLAPWHLEISECGLVHRSPGEGGLPNAERGRAATRPFWTVAPNFVDTEVFRPSATEDEKRECRRALGIPEDAIVVGTAAAVKKHHKRIDHLLREFAAFLSAHRHSNTGPVPYLVIAGSRQQETDELIALARDVAGERTRILLDLPRERMPGFYRALDVFVLTSLFEMMPIAVLEALASGIPVIANDHPVLRWMIGVDQAPGGKTVDMATEGALAECLAGTRPGWCERCGTSARRRAMSMFSRDVVVDAYEAYYRRVSADAEGT